MVDERPNGPSSRTILITGAASGIGAACARRFLDEGWIVLGWDLRRGDEARVRWNAVDVSDWEAVGALSRDLPPLAAVVTCAGISPRTQALEMSREEWDRVININLSGAFYVARWVYPALVAARGVLVNVASIMAGRGFRDKAGYSVSKAGVVALTRQLAIEWAGAGIRVIVVSPGYTRTRMLDDAVKQGRLDEGRIIRRTPQARILSPEEVAGAIHRLTSPEFASLTGSEVLLDGGFSALSGF